MDNYISDEIPKHKKKSRRKKPKKSSHKHNYVHKKDEVKFEFVNNSKWWMNRVSECDICGKVKEEFFIMRKDE